MAQNKPEPQSTTMRAPSFPGFRHVAVCTQQLESRGPAVFPQPPVQRFSRPGFRTVRSLFPAVFGPIIVHVVYNQERFFTLATTRALSAVSFYRLQPQVLPGFSLGRVKSFSFFFGTSSVSMFALEAPSSPNFPIFTVVQLSKLSVRFCLVAIPTLSSWHDT